MQEERITIRECRPGDAESIATFYNKFDYGTVSSGHPLKGSDLWRLFDEREIALYLMMEYEGSVIATMLFCNLSGQRMAEPGAVWAGYFLIHPEFRKGTLPGRFFSEAIPRLIEKGYRFIDTEVDPTNLSAMGLYKRVGMYQTSRSYLDYDGYLNLRSYLPYVVNYLMTGFRAYITKSDEDSLSDRGWKSLLGGAPGSGPRRSAQLDSVMENGSETVAYQMQFGQDVITCWVDIRSEKVTKIDDSKFRFESYILEGQDLLVGQQIRVRFEYENRLDSQVLVKFQTRLGKQKVGYKQGKTRRLLQSGETCTWEEMITLTEAFTGDLVTRVQFGKASFDFHYGVAVRPQLELSLLQHSVFTSQTRNTHVRLINCTDRQLHGHLQVEADTPILQAKLESSASFTMEPGVILDLPLQLFGQAPGVSGVRLKAYSHTHELLGESRLEVPVLAFGQVANYKQGNRHVLENPYLSVQVDQTTGALYLYDQQTGQQIVQEAWPDLDLPFYGGVKEMNGRSLERMPDNSNAIVLKESRNHGAELVRRISFVSERMIRIQDEANKGERLKLHPWCMLRNAAVSIPLKEGTLKSTLVYEDFPFQIHDFEYAHDFELPVAPEAYAMSWTAFENRDVTVGMLWNGNVESLLYGLRWMPAIVFKESQPPSHRRFLQKNQSKIRADHYYTTTEAGAQAVERLYKSNFGNSAPLQPTIDRVQICVEPLHVGSADQSARIEGELTTPLLHDMNGTLQLRVPALDFEQAVTVEGLRASKPRSFAFELPIGSETSLLPATLTFENASRGLRVEQQVSILRQEPEAIVSVEEKKAYYQVKNGPLQWKVAPDHQAALISLKYRGKELLVSNFPTLGNFGQNTSIPCGIFPHRMQQEINLQNGLLFQPKHLETFAGEPIHSTDPTARSWQGVRCQGEGITVDYLTLPGVPLLRIDLHVGEDSQALQSFQYALHSFWNGFGSKRAKTVHYWNSLGQQVLTESGVRRRAYGEPRAVLEIGEQLFVALWMPSAQAELAIYEWSGKGFQTLLHRPVRVAKGSEQVVSAYVAIGQSMAECLHYFQITREENA